MTDLPQWAVERAKELVTGVLSGAMAAHDIGQTPEETGIELAAYVARALAEAAKPGWQPIETAPRDASVDLWTSEGRLCECRWVSGNGCHPVAGWFSPDLNHGDGDWLDSHGIIATHWMEPPAPPEVG